MSPIIIEWYKRPLEWRWGWCNSVADSRRTYSRDLQFTVLSLSFSSSFNWRSEEVTETENEAQRWRSWKKCGFWQREAWSVPRPAFRFQEHAGLSQDLPSALSCIITIEGQSVQSAIQSCVLWYSPAVLHAKIWAVIVFLGKKCTSRGLL